ncbi:MAG: NADP-dependent isocitrate dehydrogenase [Syntrophus sp. (in: bacteria)]|nr:NADP-dependent isocitrate dehydrogenase [Syntrophus sp. (in: bacteria)]
MENLTEIIKIPCIAGDGIGDDIWSASREIFEEALIKGTAGQKKIKWIPLLAGLKALEKEDKLLPDKTLETVKEYKIAIKGPLTTPVGGGFRSVNVHLRQIFDLYTCVRPVRYFKGLPSPLKTPEKVDVIILRENTEDIYKGIEWKEGTEESKMILDFLKNKMNVSLSSDTGIGIKPISKTGTVRFTKWAIDYAIKNKRRSITVVHKGNIMKYTEGAFREWAYEVAKEYPKAISFEESDEKILFNDRIADNMFMQMILRPDEYDILLCPNLNGDYLSDACAALIGGLGVAPGANIGDNVAIFEPTHGSAPKYAGKDMVNPTSLILSGALMFRYMGFDAVATLIEKAVEETIQNGLVTYDLARQMVDVKPVSSSRFGREVAERL